MCDNVCQFCIERNGVKGEKTSVNRLIMEPIKTGKKEILILGVEPLLLPHVEKSAPLWVISMWEKFLASKI